MQLYLPLIHSSRFDNSISDNNLEYGGGTHRQIVIEKLKNKKFFSISKKSKTPEPEEEQP